MKLKVNYDEYGAYVDYEGKRYHIFLDMEEYDTFTIKEIICELIDTYVVIEEKSDKE